MSNFMNSVKNFLRDEEGLTVVEYVVGAALLVVGLTAVFTGLGTDLDAKLSSTVSSIGS